MDAYTLAQRYVGIQEIGGEQDHPLIRWWLSLCFDGKLDLHDETPWCSAFANGIAWELRLPRSKSARARSWLLTGQPVALDAAQVGNDVVVLNRGGDPDPRVIASNGHVGFFAGRDSIHSRVLLLGGNQSNGVSIASFDINNVLGVRRLG